MEVTRFTCADPAFLPQSFFSLNSTGADHGFSPPSFDSRVQIWPFTLSFTGANRGYLPPSFFSLNSTGADHGFLPPLLDSRVQIRPFCPVGFHGCCPRTAARARSAQGASQFAAGYAVVRLTHHSDDRPVHIMKTS